MKDFLKKQFLLILVVCCIRVIKLIELYIARISPPKTDITYADFWSYMIVVPLIVFAICYRNKKALQMIGSAFLLFVWWFIIFLIEVYFGWIHWIERMIGMILVSDTDQSAGLLEVFYLFWIFIVSTGTIVVKAIVSLFLIIRQNLKKKNQKHAE